MARDFTKNTSNYCRFSTNTIGPLINGAAAISMHCRVWFDTLANDAGTCDDLIFIGISPAAAGASIHLVGATPKMRIGGRSTSADSFQSKSSTTTITTGRWWSLGGVMNIAADTITPYIDGAAEGGGSVTFGATTYTHSSTTACDGFGAGYTGTTPVSTTRQLDGRLAEIGIWNGDIGAEGFAALADGVSPLMVRPDLLVGYWPMMGRTSPEIDLLNNQKPVTLFGTVAQAEHPPMRYPGRVQAWKAPAAAPGGFKAARARNANVVINPLAMAA